MQELRFDPEHDPLVGVPVRMDDGLVQLQRADQQQIPRLQLVGLALHQIIHTSPQKEIHLVKIMVVQCHRPQVPVLIIEDFIAVTLHFLPGVEMLESIWHGNHLPCYYTARFTILTAIFAILVVIIKVYSKQKKNRRKEDVSWNAF